MARDRATEPLYSISHTHFRKILQFFASVGRQLHQTHTKTHLLVLDSLGELVAEGEVGDGDVVHDEVELLRAVGELVADAGADRLTLAQQLLSVVLRHDRLQDLGGAERPGHVSRR